MATYYVETYRPAYPSKVKLDFSVTKEADWSVDTMSPCMTAVFQRGGQVHAADGAGEVLA